MSKFHTFFKRIDARANKLNCDKMTELCERMKALEKSINNLALKSSLQVGKQCLMPDLSSTSLPLDNLEECGALTKAVKEVSEEKATLVRKLLVFFGIYF